MGWSSGTEIFRNCIKVIQPNVPDFKIRKKIYKGMMEVFESADWDTQEECYGLDKAFDEVLDKKIYEN